MSEQAAIVAIVAIICLSLSMCTVGLRWAHIEEAKVQLERDKLGLK